MSDAEKEKIEAAARELKATLLEASGYKRVRRVALTVRAMRGGR